MDIIKAVFGERRKKNMFLIILSLVLSLALQTRADSENGEEDLDQ